MFKAVPMGQSSKRFFTHSHAKTIRHQGMEYPLRRPRVDDRAAHSRRGPMHRHSGVDRNGKTTVVSLFLSVIATFGFGTHVLGGKNVYRTNFKIFSMKKKKKNV